MFLVNPSDGNCKPGIIQLAVLMSPTAVDFMTTGTEPCDRLMSLAGLGLLLLMEQRAEGEVTPLPPVDASVPMPMERRRSADMIGLF